ncbi:hypothetical protein KKG31_07850 [Patescibacteria group bacterium]|nr:hypothetical protein [Patescibacteria group bacterium]MBU1758979.1 hypothetical protein [Patescibacteria group bacterium]
MFSGVSGTETTSPTITDSQEIKVVKGYLDIKYEGDTIFEDNDPETTQSIDFSLVGAEDIIVTDSSGNQSTDTSQLPSITLKLRRANGTIISDLESPVLISTQKRLLQPGKVVDNKFKKT